MSHLKLFLSFLLAILNCCHAFGQLSSSPYLVQKANIKGLPENTLLTSLLQDKKGFLWIGTLNGLYRYDGYRSSLFRNTPSDTNSLSHNYVQCLTQDKQNNIWIGTYGGAMNVFNFAQSTLQRISPEVLGVNQPIVNKVVVPKKGNYFWVASTKFLYKLSAEKKVLQKFTLPFTHSLNTITDFIEASENKIVVATNVGLFYIDADKNDIKSIYPAKTNQQKISYNSVIKRDSVIWVGGENGLTVFNALTLQPVNNFISNKVSNDTILKIYSDKENNIWIISNHKISIYNLQTSSIYVVTDKVYGITDIMHDKGGVIWISTVKQGLFKIVKPAIAFHTLANLDVFTKGQRITCISEQSDSTWLIGTDKFLLDYNLKTNSTEKINIPVKTSQPQFNSILIDSKKNLWIGTQYEGVFCKQAGSNNFNKINFSSQDQFSPAITSICESNGKIWAGVFTITPIKSGLFYFDPVEKKFIQKIFSSQSSFLIPAAISEIRNMRDELWVGTWNGGLFKINTAKQEVQNNFSIKSPLQHRITLNVVSSVYIDKKDQVWFGTVGGGFNGYFPLQDSVHYFTVADGLPSNLIYRIEEDKNENLWISTDNGLSQFDKNNKSFTNYGVTTGLSSINFSFLSSIKCKEGTMAFGTNDGKVIFFNPVSGEKEVNVLPTIITDIRLANKSIIPSKGNALNSAAYLTERVNLNYSDNVISFELSNMDFLNPEIYTYAYKLEGFDKDWNYSTDRNSITYTNLDQGTYTLLVKNANHRGIWNETPTKLLLIIKPPFWQTWWFISLIIAATAALIYALFRYRLQQKLRVLQIRNSLHRDLHDDVGATLSSVKAYSEILKDNPDNPVIAELIKDNSTEMLERLEVISWATNPQHDNFKSLYDKMNKFAQPLCHAHAVDFVFEKDGINDNLVIPADVRQNTFLVFKEAINNIIKYAGASQCKSSLATINQKFILQVADNGVGMDGTIRGNGSGIKNMKKRAEALKGCLEVENISPKGTSVKLVIQYPFKIPNTWDGNKNGK